MTKRLEKRPDGTIVVVSHHHTANSLLASRNGRSARRGDDHRPHLGGYQRRRRGVCRGYEHRQHRWNRAASDRSRRELSSSAPLAAYAASGTDRARARARARPESDERRPVGAECDSHPHEPLAHAPLMLTQERARSSANPPGGSSSARRMRSRSSIDRPRTIVSRSTAFRRTVAVGSSTRLASSLTSSIANPNPGEHHRGDHAFVFANGL